MSRNGKLLSALLIIAAAIGFAYAQMEIAAKSIQFDLRKIGESIYEAHSRTGKWPEKIADLSGTEYLRMSHRKALLEEGKFVVIWQKDLDSRAEANRNRILAYDNGSLLSRFGRVWVCRGDLRVDRWRAGEEKLPGARRR